jgi:hypothetical protein
LGTLGGVAKGVGSIPGMPDIAGAVQSAIMKNPTVAQVAKTATSIKDLTTTIPKVKDNIIDQVKTTVDSTVKSTVAKSLSAAGITPGYGAAAAAPTSGYGATTSSYGEAPTETEAQSGGAKYEMVELSEKVEDPLYVYYDNGKPIYFTHNSRDEVKIYTGARHKHTKKMKNQKPAVRSKATKKVNKKGARKQSRKSGQRRSRRS